MSEYWIAVLIAITSLTIVLVVAMVCWRIWKELRRTRALFRISLRLNSTIERKELLRIIMETAEKEMQAEGSAIILADEAKQELYFEVATGDKGEAVKEIRLPFGEGVAGWVAQTGQSVLIPNVAKDPRWSNRVSSKVNMPTRNMVCVPVSSSGQTLGVLQVINKKGNRSFKRSDLQLLEMIASPSAVALENMFLYEALKTSMDSLRETTAAKERLESELKIARDIQTSFLPGNSLQYGHMELHASLIPAREVGGDFYHYLDLGNNKLLICLGDVSDKGMPAALFMSGLMIWIQAKAASHMTPAQIVTAINEEVANDDSTMFATLFLAIADTLTGHLTYCDAGHCPPLITGPGGVRELETAKHLPVGIFADEQYTNKETVLKPDESLILYTDGVTEAENAAGEWFTLEKLMSVLEHCEASTPQQLNGYLQSCVLEFADHHPQSDDIAIMVTKFNKNIA